MREGWEVKPWKDVLEIRSGRNQKEVMKPDGKYPILGSAGKIMGYADKYICEQGTTIIGRKGTINNPLMIETKFWNVDTAFGLHALNELDKYYLFYFCQNFDFTELDKGSGRPSLVKSDLLKIQIPVPPLPEQTQIVNTLDKAFKQIDQAKVNLEKNLHNAKELFQSKLNEVFSQRGEGWEEKKLGDVCTLYQGLAINKKTKHLLVEKSTIPLLRIKDLKNNTVEQYVAEVGYPQNSFVTEEEIIYTRTGSLGLVFRGKRGVLHNNSFKIIPNELLTNDYLFWWLQHEAFTKIIISLASKAAQPDITHKLFKEQIIFIPSIEAQKHYYLEIEKLNELSNNLQTHYQQKLNNLEELKKSILQKAFRGELV